MVKNTRSPKRQPGSPKCEDLAFTPARLRERHDGWTAEKQIAFIEALAECACVDEACRRVGMSDSAAYALRRRPDAQSFRRAWDAALDYGVRRLSDAVFSRALHGVSRPVFYKGELIGERRYYDERLALFLLRYRDPVRYGRWNDNVTFRQHPDGSAILLAKRLQQLTDDSIADELGLERFERITIDEPEIVSSEEAAREQASRRQARAEAREQAEWRRMVRQAKGGVG